MSTLLTHFPYLAGALGSVYTPWSFQRENEESRHSLVICAGSRNFHLDGSRAPIEIAYAGDDDLKPEHRKFFPSSNHTSPSSISSNGFRQLDAIWPVVAGP